MRLTWCVCLFFQGFVYSLSHIHTRACAYTPTMQPVVPNPNLPGLTQSEAVVLSEKTSHVAYEGFEFCSRRCITHFGEDSVPNHPGEKACLNRCISKLRVGMYLAIDVRKSFEERLGQGDFPYKWMRDASQGNLHP